MYFVPNSVLVGRIFFEEEALQLRLFYGSVLLLGLISIAGSIIYFIYDYSELTMLLTLALLALILSVLNRKKSSKSNVNSFPKPIQMEKLLHIRVHVSEVFFLFFIFLSFYLLFIARTGESLKTPFDVVSPLFFVSYFLSVASLLFMIFSLRGKTRRLLLYVIALIFVSPSIYLLVLKYPAELGSWLHITFERYFATFGRFVSAPNQIEVATGTIHKNIAYIGYYDLVVTFSRFLQIDPLWIHEFITPVLYSICVPVASYLLVTTMKPREKKLGLIAAVAVLLSQHNIFLTVPPDKPETLALAFLLLLILFWVKTFEKPSKAKFLMIVTLTVSTILIHEYVGYYALFATCVSFYLYKARPFSGEHSNSVRARRVHALRLLGFCFVLCLFLIGFMFAPLLFSLVSSPTLGYAATLNPQANLGAWLNIIFPPLWQNTNLPLTGQVFYGYLNNFTYVLYGLILIGIVASFKIKLNKNWIALTSSLILLSLSNMISVKYVIQLNDVWSGEFYRFFYIMNFVTFILVGVGVCLILKLKVRPFLKVGKHFGEAGKRLGSFALKLLVILILSSLMAASLIGGFPRPDSMGPYKGVNLAYVSDYDIEAVRFIKGTASTQNQNFFMFTDLYTSCAVLSEIGFEQIHTAQGSFTIYSAKPFDAPPWQLWLELIEKPSLHPFVSIANITGVKVVYAVLSYRLGQETLGELVSYYTKYLGEPIFRIEGKIYVFEYKSGEVSQMVVAGDEQASKGFWAVDRIHNGTIDVSLSDDQVMKIDGKDSLRVAIQNGSYERFTLRHEYDENQDWSKMNYMTMEWYGSASGNNINIVVDGGSVNPNAFVYHFEDDFVGWKETVIPLSQFTVEIGTPDWSSVKILMLQFQHGFQPGNWYLDRISLFGNLSNS
jgi:hypothetical protein